MPGLADRMLEEEIMDQPGLDAQAHHEALMGIGRVNWISGINGLLWQALMKFRLPNETRPLRVLDLASGGGDVAIQLAQRALYQGVPLDIHGVDISQTAVEFAQARADALHLANVRFQQQDVLHDDLNSTYDVVMSSLFLHHLSEQQAVFLLQKMSSMAERGILLDDLCRSRLGYFLAWCGVRLLTRSAIVHFDGPQSVRAAFRMNEVHSLATQAGLDQIQLQHHWPQRFLLTWKRPC